MRKPILRKGYSWKEDASVSHCQDKTQLLLLGSEDKFLEGPSLSSHSHSLKGTKGLKQLMTLITLGMFQDTT